MGFSTGNGRGPSPTMSEINVTPLVDVMLVLLIIFMISAPLLQSGIEIDLPKGNTEMKVNENHLILSLDGAGKAYLNDEYLQPELIVEKVKSAIAADAGRTVYLHADKSLAYGEVAEMLSQLRESGIEQVSLITEPRNEGK